MVVGYKVSPLETWLRFVVKVPSIVLPNLILGENFIPEFIQGDCTPEALASALCPLVGQSRDRTLQVEAFARLEAAMAIAPGVTPSRLAAEVVLSATRD